MTPPSTLHRPQALDGVAGSVLAHERAAIEEYFSGDAALFLAFRAHCRRQFAHDVREGDAACAAADGPALRHLAHNLKAVLRTLGEDAAAARAVAAEQCAGEPAGAAAWQDLRRSLLALLEPPAA